MIRKASPQAVNAKMYKHFAVVTVVLTGTLAIFADGEGQEARAEQAAPVEAAASEQPILVRTPDAESRAYDTQDAYDDVGGSFGSAMDSAGGGFDSSGIDEESLTPGMFGNVVPGGLSELGLSAGSLAELSEAEKQAMLSRLRARRERAAANMAEESRLRSGGTGENSDARR